MTAPLRILAAAAVSTAGLLSAAFAWEAARFGWSTSHTLTRLEADVRRTVMTRAALVEDLAANVTTLGTLVGRAVDTPAERRALFERLDQFASSDRDRRVAATVYLPTGRGDDYRVLAWSDGPGEQNLSTGRLSQPPALFVAPGHAGLRLIKVAGIEADGRRVGVVVTECVLAPVDRRTATDLGADHHLATRFGTVTLAPLYTSARDANTSGDRFTIEIGGAPLLEVRTELAELVETRSAFRQRVVALALIPLPVALGLLAGWAAARRGTRPAPLIWVRWTTTAVGLVGAAALGAWGIARLAGWAGPPGGLIMATAALAVVVLTFGDGWWRTGRGARPHRRPIRFVVEHLVAGCWLTAVLWVIDGLVGRAVNRAVSAGGSLASVLPISTDGVLAVTTALVGSIALGWAAYGGLALAATRWRLWPFRLPTVGAVLLWAIPVSAAIAFSDPIGRHAMAIAFVAAIAMAAAAAAGGLRRGYHRAPAATRLVALFVAMVAPPLTIYPLAASVSAASARELVRDTYTPALEQHPQELRRILAAAQADVDRLPIVNHIVTAGPTTDDGHADGRAMSRPSYLVWSQTSLARSRVISDVEIFGADQTLVSRFAFNLPEYINQTVQQGRLPTSCEWDVFGELRPVGAEPRRMLHAERSVCDAQGQVIGGIVLHVASDDYEALPFVTSPSPYVEAVSDPARGTARLPDLGIAVYGWSQRRLFTSGPATWPLPLDIFDELYTRGVPLWRALSVDGRIVDVYFSQSRSGVSAVGLPRATAVDHASRAAEISAMTAVLFIVFQLGAAMTAGVWPRRPTDAGALWREIRTSFYRKLFLSFVAVAILPVIVAATVFGTYMATRFQDDVAREAATTVGVARRVLEELNSAGGRSDVRPTDDAMVWIRQVTGEDVNYFEGSELVATSQPDLFDSGLLPTRTPATVYRGVALERRPTFVAADRIGAFEYLVAAAPVPSRGPEALLTVPLASRQRELGAELEALGRRVLVGAVLVVLFAGVLGAYLAGRVAGPVGRLTRATRQIAAGQLDVRIGSESTDEFGRLVDDFNSMAATLGEQRAALARTNQLKAWNEMARQVAHEIKNPLTPVQLSAEHLQLVHNDRGRPLGDVLDRCVTTILTQVRLLRRIASEFANFSSEPVSRPTAESLAALASDVVDPYRTGTVGRITFDVQIPTDLPPVLADRTLLLRALTNIVENAVQAMPSGGTLRIDARRVDPDQVELRVADNGPGMDEPTTARAFEPFFSTKAAGSGLGLANAKRAIEREGGTITLTSTIGAGTTVIMRLRRA